ncbi:hypothetical protein [Mesorhizobium sp. M1A.F.Ca.IN.020.04.1.1]|uniref:hypothetical protein n=1 Tax=Mesorhizobium sp. M1A.F.Ca.IN.020.04.1.1 TaxID=2496761 RepID=UPI000FC9ADD8|nr:hypothetical protein [Mesorhizobium sp. M1A.F.Ca.IN.020.04.1.1]RUW04069.1 hypothetical protein EOA49_00645 [Mesorhizobium sp. M1A.F.Ca.IN.020.04.1.1]RUW04132.1 hypothetical protein EOA49_00980 [Mesorhizobium sp. M1A.F.Ca.IN.020.04.1.1]
MTDITRIRLEQGDEFPYDATDQWWRSRAKQPPKARDWAHRAARAIIADLKDRRDIKRGFEQIDQDVRMEIVDSLAAIIRAASSSPSP